MSKINKTQLNKFKRLIESGKQFIDDKKLKDNQEEKTYSKAITMAVLREYYDLDQASAFNSITDGSGDNKIDGLYYNDNDDELDVLVLIQSKYKKIDGSTDTFTEDDIRLCLSNANLLLQGKDFNVENSILSEKISNYKQKLVDSDMPAISIKFFFATNGIISEVHKNLEEVINSRKDGIEVFFVDATEFGCQPAALRGEINVNLKNSVDRTDSIFSIDDIQYRGVIASCSIRDLMIFYEKAGSNLLLNENVRFLQKNSKINERIKASFLNDPKRFCYLNNGISIVCSSFEMKATLFQITKIEMATPSVVNGGQTLASLYQIYSTQEDQYSKNFDEAKILLRIYQVPNAYSIEIAQATNSQNPIKIVDLHSNDTPQLIAQEYFARQGIGLIIKSGADTTDYDDVIKNEALLQVYAALYFKDPAKAKVSKSAVFNKYYTQVFNKDIDETVCKKMFRCYYLSKYVSEFDLIDEVVRKNAFYSIIYLMGEISSSISNENIPERELTDALLDAITDASDIIEQIITQKKDSLGVKFSMNNLFKGTEIKDLMDLTLNRVRTESTS